MGKTVVVLGGGVGGLVAASELRKHLPREHRVVLIERDGKHRFQPSFLWVMEGTREPAGVVRDLARFRTKGVEVRREEATAVDLEGRKVRTAAGELPFDFLVLSPGADLDPAAVPGLASAGETFFTIEGALALHTRLAAFRDGKVAVVVSRLPFKCPAAPYEAALLIEAQLRRRGLGGGAQVDVYTPEKLPMPVAGPKVGEALKGLLESRGIGFHPEHTVRSADAASKSLTFENGAAAAFDLLAYAPPHRAPAVVRDAGLTDASGFVPVDPGTMATKHAGVFAIGDVAAVRLESGKMLPKAGVFAHAQALVVARNIAAEVAGKPAAQRFDGHGFCWVEAGAGKAAFGVGNFYASPSPDIALKPPSRFRHWGKVAFEKYWLWRWFRRGG